MSNNIEFATKVNINETVSFIWKIANKLRGPYKPDKYKDVIIPMSIIRRLECVLEDTKPNVLAIADQWGHIEKKMNAEAGFNFHNQSEFDLNKLLNDPDNIASNFKSYLQGFSKEVRDIIEKLKFEDEIDYLDSKNRLYGIVKEFSLIDLHPDKITNSEMGYIFEDLIRRFSENAVAGDHYTPRETIKLAVNILLSEDIDTLTKDGNIVSMYDGTSGTGGMLAVGEEYIKSLNSDTDIELFGQEFNDESYAICKADMLIKGQDTANIVLGNTLTHDGFADRKFKYSLMNPPYGENWSDEYNTVKKEYDEKGFNGRFGAGLPSKDDGSLLFVQHMIDKLEDNGRGAIVLSGSPLFSGKAGSGESNIRKWMLENDLIEGIIALPQDLFYNTGIGTYIWIFAKNKSEKRQGKIQLLDAREYGTKLRKSLGKKRNEITSEHIVELTEIYHNFRESDICKIMDNEDFLYREVVIQRPFRRSFSIREDRFDNLYSQTSFANLFNEEVFEELSSKDENRLTTKEKEKLEKFKKGKLLQEEIISKLKLNISDEVYLNKNEFESKLKNIFKDNKGVKPGVINAILMGLSIQYNNAEVSYDKKGNIEFDSDLKDSEIIPFKEDINDYFEREVLPHVPDAILDDSEIKIGAEIPFTRLFYKYESVGSYEEYIKRAQELELEISQLLKEVL